MKGSKGFTLIEVVATIVILTLLLTSFLLLLLSSAKNTQVSKGVVDYTLMAQTEIELFYNFAKSSSQANQQKILLDKMGYSVYAQNGSAVTYEKSTANATIQFTTSPYTVNNNLSNVLSRVIIEILPQEKSRVGAKIESLIEWGGAS